MDYNSAYEQEIDLKDLIFSILRKWKLMILFGMLFAVILGGYKGFSSYRSGTSADTIEAADMKYRDARLEYDKKKGSLENEIDKIIEDIADQEEYLEKSIWLKISPYDICEARADIYVTTDYTIMPGMSYQNVDYAETILQVYQSLLTSNEVNEEISLKADTEPRYLSELVSVSRSDRIITINVKHVDKEKAQAVLDDMVTWLNDLKPQVVSMIGEHTINIVNSSTSSSVDLAHAETQRNQEQKLVDLQISLETKQKELDELEEPKKDEFNIKNVVKSAIKFAIIGGVLGAGMVVMGVCVIFLMSDKVYSAKELKARFGVKVLGALPGNACKCPIDQWLNKLEGRVFESDEEIRNSLIAQNVRNGLGEVKTLLVLGGANAAHVETIAKAFEEKLPEIQVIAGGNMLKEVETLKKLPECDGVVLVEECGISSYNDIAQEIEKAVDLGKSIIGCVVVG